MIDQYYLMEELIRAVKMLASNPEQQVEYLEGLGVAPCTDELAMELDDIINTPIELSTELKDRLSVLDRKLLSMSGAENAELWDTRALYTAEEWQEVRRLAKDVMSLLEKIDLGDPPRNGVGLKKTIIR